MKILCHSPGAIDLQINGALGISFNQLNPATASRLPEICRFLWQQGLDGFLPTLVTTSDQDLHQSLGHIANYLRQPRSPQTAEILGVHLEGPFLHPDRRGAHPAQHLRSLNLDQVKQVLGDYAPIVKLITLAPELDPSNRVIPFLVNLGIKVSLGHSTATTAIAKQAFDLGATMITHACNAMPPLHHREPGLLGEALTNSLVWCGAIADGIHVHPQMLDLLWRLKGDRLVLVSDALAPLGLPDGKYPWDQRQITVIQGTARLEDGTLSGTTLSLIDCVKNLVGWQTCDLEQAIALAVNSPRQFLGLAETPQADSLTWYYPNSGELATCRSSDISSTTINFSESFSGADDKRE